MARVVERIDAEQDASPDLETISGWAGFSPYHFHRQFRALSGMPVQRFVQLSRLHRAGTKLAYQPRTRVTDAALDAGYEAPEAFTRAFRAWIGQTPSAFRAGPDWLAWQALSNTLQATRNRAMVETTAIDDVEIRVFASVHVAVMAHRGDMAKIGDTIRRFIDWRQSAGFVPPGSRTFNLFPTDPRTTPIEDHLVMLCASVPAWFAGDSPAGVRVDEIPGGRYAVLPITGPAMDLEESALWLYREWLPASGESLRDYPLFCERVRLYPQFSATEALTEMFLPLA
ncbi:GyrI-like domain-containing protein [Novosphingobium sp. PhB165]|uniref:AraC family transcriptional regulator n=1 Tax=Novosphingobium sp. PhB165 TaxID=2485105 RepID=UPI001FB48014|nr:GyrI-like domain-containing protein [Novosphingobium sp. PhB165]